jgi:hypothetical protein
LVALILLRNLFVPVLIGCLEKAPISCDFFFLTYNSLCCIFNSSQSEFLSKVLIKPKRVLIKFNSSQSEFLSNSYQRKRSVTAGSDTAPPSGENLIDTEAATPYKEPARRQHQVRFLGLEPLPSREGESS